MGREIHFYMYKNAKFKDQFFKKFYGIINNELEEYSNDEDSKYSEPYDLAGHDEEGTLIIFSSPKIYYEHIIDSILNFWENICRKYFFDEIALINCSEFWDEDNIFYYHKGETHTIWHGDEAGFMTSFVLKVLKRYNKLFQLNKIPEKKEEGFIRSEITKERKKDREEEKLTLISKINLDQSDNKIREMEFQLKLLRRQKELENGDIIVKLNKENLEIMKGEVDYKQELKDFSKEIIEGMENKIKKITGAKK